MRKRFPYELADHNVLVTGGAGFVGSTLVRELLKEKCRVVVYDNFLHGVKANIEEIKDQIDIVPGDVLDTWKLTEAAQKYKVSYIFHCVGDTYVPTAYDVPVRFFRINVEGTLNALLVCKLFKMKRMLYVSSTEVYGEAKTEKVAEDHPLFPLNTYAVSKLAADRTCFTFFHEHNVPVIVARIFNSYGPRESEPYVIPEIITQLSRSNNVELGNLKAERDFTYVEDTARGLIAAMKSGIPNGTPVNVGSGVTYSVEHLAHLIGNLMGRDKVTIKVARNRLRRLDINRFCCDNSKLVKYTDWRPQVSIDEGLRRTIQWFKTQGNRWSWEDFTEGTMTYR
jgi:nucleoside-diphosphate-sugar epimerase